MLRKLIKITIIVVAVAFVVAQFIRPNFSNPQVNIGETLTAGTDVPADVQQILTQSCYDCHSNQTSYPWYSKVTPFNWFLADHVEEGRAELNFSTWNTYTREKKIHKLEEICEQIEQASMPLPSYLWIHWDAVLSESESKAICDWTKTETTRLTAVP